MKRRRILCVDDEKNICRLLKVNLEAEGYSVDIAFNGEEALKRLKKKSYDLVITDLLMPKLDGWELLKRIKSETRNKNTPVIVLSVVKKEKNFLEVDAYLVKPFDVKKLSQEVKTILESKNV